MSVAVTSNRADDSVQVEHVDLHAVQAALHAVKREGWRRRGAGDPEMGKIGKPGRRLEEVVKVVATALRDVDDRLYFDLDYPIEADGQTDLPHALLMEGIPASETVELHWTRKTLTFKRKGKRASWTVFLHHPDAGADLTVAVANIAGDHFAPRAWTTQKRVY
nr:hypothetical protein [Brevundimonas diminuta]